MDPLTQYFCRLGAEAIKLYGPDVVDCIGHAKDAVANWWNGDAEVTKPTEEDAKAAAAAQGVCEAEIATTGAATAEAEREAELGEHRARKVAFDDVTSL